MKTLKKILYKILGKRYYYLFVSKAFFILYRSGLLKASRKFEYHYYVKDLIEPGYHVIDIGANMGYYTKIFARECGIKGQVYAIEPVALFREVLERNVRKLDNIRIYPFALGKEDGKKIKMGIPGGAEKHRHGLTKVLDNENYREKDDLFEATMHTPDHLFGNIERCDYIKCDVEGYEIHVIPLFEKIITEHRPLLQVETNTGSRKVIIPLLEKLGYRAYHIMNKELKVYEQESRPAGDLIFLPGEHTSVPGSVNATV